MTKNFHKYLIEGVRVLIAVTLIAFMFWSAGNSLADPVISSGKTPAVEKGRVQEIYRISRLARNAEADGKLERALELWQAVMSQQPDDYSAYRGIQGALGELGRFDEALEFLDSMLPKVQSGKSRISPMMIKADRIAILYWAGDDDKAGEETDTFLHEYIGQQKAYTEIATVLFGRRKDDAAVDVIQQGRKECNDSFLYARELARFHEVRMSWENAVEEYILYLEDRPDRLTYVTGAIGDLPAGAGADSIAVEVISRRIEDVDKDFSTVLRRLLASLHFKAKRYEEALSQYKLLDEIAQDQGSELLKFAGLLKVEGEYDLALEGYHELISSGSSASNIAQARLGKGLVFLALDEIDSARIAFETLIDADSSMAVSFEAYHNLGNLALDYYNLPGKARDYFESALNAAVKARISSVKKDEIRVSIALSWEKEGQLDRAYRELKAILQENRSKTRAVSFAMLELTRIAFRKGDLEEMNVRANSLLIADPSSEYANDALTYSAMLKDLKNNPDAIKALGRADLADFMNDYHRAAHILDSLAADPEASGRTVEEALWRLSTLNIKHGNFRLALEALEEIINFNGETLKGDLALFTAGKLSEEVLDSPQMAEGYYERLLIEYPESPLENQARRRLNKLIRDPS